jgi:hypothetical protein
MLLVLRKLAIGVEVRRGDWVWGGVLNLGALEAVGVVEGSKMVYGWCLCMFWRFVDSKHCVRMACVKIQGSREGMVVVLVAWCL